AMDELLATQQKILTAFRESATDGDSAGVPFALQEQEARLVGQVGSLIDVVSAETYEVRGVRGAWHCLHAASQSFLHVSSRIQLGISDFERIPLSSVLPDVPEFLAHLEARLTEARSLLGGAPARPCRDVALEVDADAFGALGHFARAGAVAGRTELLALDAHTRTIVECALEIREDKRAASTPSADTTKVRGPLALLPLDRDQLMGAIIAVATMWGGTLIWIYVNPPGHVSWFQFPTNLVLVALLNPQMRFFPLRVLGYAYFAAMLVYVFIMPHLTGFVQLGSLLFAFTFITAYFFPKAATFLLLAMFTMFGIANEQTYDFASMMNTYVFTMSVILMVYGVTYLIGSPRPEKTMLRQVRRFFRSCEFLVSRPAKPDSWFDRVKQAYHRRELQTLPAKMATWGAQIDQKRFPQNSAEQVKALAVRLGLLAFRIDDLLNLRSTGAPRARVPRMVRRRRVGSQAGPGRAPFGRAHSAKCSRRGGGEPHSDGRDR
ncbi:MAG: FUSC family protein, partial [Deltaproteobacteria bacterium]|nr:FUSC family protein [Deltaproteobacteria bacterium]